MGMGDPVKVSSKGPPDSSTYQDLPSPFSWHLVPELPSAKPLYPMFNLILGAVWAGRDIQMVCLEVPLCAISCSDFRTHIHLPYSRPGTCSSGSPGPRSRWGVRTRDTKQLSLPLLGLAVSFHAGSHGPLSSRLSWR